MEFHHLYVAINTQRTGNTLVVCGQPWPNILAYGGHGGSGVGVTLEVRLHRLVMGENGCRESGKIPRVGYLRRGIRI